MFTRFVRPPSTISPDNATTAPVRAETERRGHQQWDVAGRFKQLAGRHTERAALLIGVLVALLWAPYLYLFEQRDASERAVQRWLPGRDSVENAELKMLDDRFATRGIVVPPSADKIAIVGIDQNSLGIIGQWPWPRDLHARLIDRLKAAGARVIVLDIDFSDRQNPSKNGELSPGDRALIDATARAGNVVLPSLPNKEVGAKDSLLFQLATPFGADLQGNDGLDEQTLDLSLAYVPQDSDGRVRRYPLMMEINGETIGGMAPLSSAIYQNLISAESRDKYIEALESGAWPTIQGQTRQIGARTTRTAGKNARRLELMPINFAGPAGTFATYSYSDVVRNFDAATMREKFANRIVLMGATAPLLKDDFAAPPFATEKKTLIPRIPGVEIHATAVSMLLDGNYLKPPIHWVSWTSLIAMALFCALWTELLRARVSAWATAIQLRWSRSGKRGRIYNLAWFSFYVGVAALPLLWFWVICSIAFQKGNLWMVAAYPLLAGAMSGGLTLVMLFGLESSGRRKVVQQLGLYMDTRVVDEILAHPEEEYPRPRRTQATVLFTDLEGFTSFSETHEAEEVVAALNAFFTRMKPIVVAHGGSIDKFVGDAMMCFFGVPLPRADHARRALQCALELQEECARFRAETGIPFRMRVGLHSGPLIVGSVGSEAMNGGAAHMNYTVIGDTVNLASRLEAKNKDFGSWIMCSRAIGEAAPDVAEFVAVRTPIRGLSAEVEVLIAVGTRERPTRALVWGAQSREEIERAEVAIAQGESVPALGQSANALPAAPTPAPSNVFEPSGKGRIFDAE